MKNGASHICDICWSQTSAQKCLPEAELLTLKEHQMRYRMLLDKITADSEEGY